MALLSTLDRVRWEDVTHAYGPAVDVPDLLRALVDPNRATEAIERAAANTNRSVRDHVIWTLWGNVFHQGTVWQATPSVIPFLFEILRDGPDDVELRRFLVSYLHHVALGYPEDLFPAKIDPETYFASREEEDEEDEHGEEDEEDDEEDEHSNAAMARYARACFEAVEEGLPAIVRLATSDHEPLALEAIACAASFQRKAAMSCDALRGVLRAEGEGARPARLAAVLVALGQLGDPGAQREAEQRVASEDAIVRWHAACGSVLANAETASEAAVAALIAPLGELANARTPFTGTLGVLVGRCLANLPPKHASRAVEAIASGLASGNATTNLAQSGTLLSIVFADGRAPRLASELTPIQRTVLEAIAKHGAFGFPDGTSFGNYSLLLSGFDLPSDAGSLKKWLAGEQPKGPSFSD